MDFNDSLKEASAATIAFENDLETLILEAFANGAAIEGTWEITLAIDDAPDWTVEITKTHPDDPTYDPEFIDK